MNSKENMKALESLIDDREWVEWGYANLTLGEAIQRLKATNADRVARGEEPLGEPPFTGLRPGRPVRWNVQRAAWCERWRFGLLLRVFHGHGLSKFEFEFRLGFPREKRPNPLYLTYEDDDA